MTTSVFSKDPSTDLAVEVDVTPLLKFGESLVSIVPQPVTPISDPPLNVAQTSVTDDPLVKLVLSGGALNVSYGFQLLITTTVRVLTTQVVATISDPNFVPYTKQDPNAYVDLVDTIQAGQSALGTAVFVFPAGRDPSGGYVVWELLDAEGVVYSSGNAYEYQIQSSGLANTVFARAVINCPSDVPPSTVNSKYQLRYTLTLNDIDPTVQNVFYSVENLTVTGLTTVPMGTQDQIELQGRPAKLSVVLDKIYDTVVLEVYKDNQVIGSAPITQYERVGAGYYYAATIETSGLPPSLEAYDVVWNYSQATDPGSVWNESAQLWITTPSIMTAIKDVQAMVNKARTTLFGTADIIFPPEVIMVWLRRGMDLFNGYSGVFTSFTMTNAKGSIREYWLQCSEVRALQSQELAEGEKAFDFQGAAISLNVDHAAAYGGLADKIQSRLDNELKPFKQNLVIKGNTTGDGSVDPSRLARGAIGAVGITITPASPWGPYRSGLPYPNVGFVK